MSSMKRIQTYLHVKQRRDQRSRPVSKRQRSTGQFGVIFGFLLFLILSAAIWVVTWQYSLITRGLPPVENLAKLLDPATGIFAHPTRLMDSSGTQVLAELTIPGVERQYLSINLTEKEHISADLINAVVASTQSDFWTSPGFSIRTFNPDEHPTIAQRLVFSLLLSNEPSSFRRAVREKLLAAQIVARYGTQQVMEWYLNSVEFGHFAYGAEAAAQTYFGKSSTLLSLPEATMLAGVSMAPALNPWDSTAGAKVLQQEVLKQMAVQRMITTDIFRAALQVPVAITEKRNNTESEWMAFTSEAIDQLSTELGKNVVERGGLLVQTTMDIDLQRQADCLLQASTLALSQNQEELLTQEKTCQAARLLPVLPPMAPVLANSLRSALVVQDPKTGQILAYSDTGQANRNDLSLTDVPIGSLITPFIYLNGFVQGLSPATMVWDAPEEGADNPNSTTPVSYHGPMRVRTALANDFLLPADNVLKQTGWPSLARLLGSFGLSVETDVSMSSQYLNIRTSLVDVAGMYGVLANSGVMAGAGSTSQPGIIDDTIFILNVWDEQGTKILDWGKPVSQPIVSSQLSFLVNQVLSDDLARAPTLGYPSILQIGNPTAAKMGVTTDKRSAWTVGYTPELVIAAWVGNLNGTSSPMDIDPRWPAGIWRALMQYQSAGGSFTTWKEPDGIIHKDVCDPSGMLPTVDCPNIVPEIFLVGNEPVEMDTIFQKVAINYETGRLATVFTPADMVTGKVFMIVPKAYHNWAVKAGLPVPPETYDDVRAEPTDPAIHFSAPAMFDYVRGKVTIMGTASSQSFNSYRIEAGKGLNPGEWVQIGFTGTKPVIEGQLAEWDTTDLNGLYALRLQVIGENNVLKTRTIQVTIDNHPPEIVLRTSSDLTKVSIKTNPQILISAQIQDETGLKEVTFLVDGEKVSSQDGSPYGYLWTTQSGSHTFQVKAEDMAGNEQLSEALVINVSP